MLTTLNASEITAGAVTDHCSVLSLEVLNRLGIADRVITLEAHVRRFPPNIRSGIFYGLSDVAEIVGPRRVMIEAINEGSIFFEGEPVLLITGTAADLALIRPALTGVLTFGTSMVTRAAEFKAAAGEKPVYFFGSRKLHPTHVLQYLECAYAGGMEIDASSVCHRIIPGALLEDCQEHYGNLVADEVQQSWRTFLELPAELGAQFIVLDNLTDPVWELKEAVKLLGLSLKGVLVDTDSSRRGDLIAILRELRWNLALLDRSDIKIALTGGLTPERIGETRDWVDSFGVGLAALSSYSFDFAIQIVAIEGTPHAKLGVRPGIKQLWGCSRCSRREVTLRTVAPPRCCDSEMEGLLGAVVPPLPGPEVIRAKVAIHTSSK